MKRKVNRFKHYIYTCTVPLETFSFFEVVLRRHFHMESLHVTAYGCISERARPLITKFHLNFHTRMTP